MENQETDSKSFTKFSKYAIKTEDLLLNTHNFNYFEVQNIQRWSAEHEKVNQSPKLHYFICAWLCH